MKKRMSWHWALPASIGLALLMVAALLSSSTIGSPGVPAAHAQAACVLDIDKDADMGTVAAGGEVTYTITVTNDGTGDCTSIVVTDSLPNDLTCVSATVIEEEDLDFDQGDIDDSCDDDDVEWAADTGDVLDENDEVVLELVVAADTDLDEDDEVENEVCVNADDVAGAPMTEACATETTTIGAAATATPQPTATRQPTVQPLPTIQPPPVVAPTIAPPIIAPPATGTGAGSGGSGPLTLGLGLVGACLLLVSGAALVTRTR